MKNEKLHIITRKLEDWYADHKRHLPWRETSDPYLIWLSEVILQQTRVDQGLDYFLRFAKRFPRVQDLAAADEDEVLKLWQGLGYYSRARNLHAASKMIVDKFDGEYPSVYNDILSLRGVGEYTASAIASISFNLPYAVVDGNVYRVLSRLFAIDDFIDTTQGKKYFSELAANLLDRDNPGLYNQAIMDFGALQCVPASPDCGSCCLADICAAYAANKVSEYPKKAGKTKVRNRYFNYIDMRFEDKMYLHKRIGKDIWQNLYELPLIESDEELELEDLLIDESFVELFAGVDIISIIPSVQLKHVLSHQRIFAKFYKVEINKSLMTTDYIEIKDSEVDLYPVSRLTEKYLER